MKFKEAKISNSQLEKLFIDCRKNKKNKCPFCDSVEFYLIENGNRFKCKKCKKKYRTWTGTNLEKNRLSKRKVYEIVNCFVEGVTGLECSRLTKLPYQTVFNLYSTIRNSLPLEKIQKEDQKTYKIFKKNYLNKFKGVSEKNEKMYIKEIKWQFRNRNSKNKIKKITRRLLDTN